ncbi:MAG: hypothetical protein COC01_00230 [Bacteroidetes bacterium]|nr:hypothetical protein [Bacteroidia bacterium]PCH69896.1 MAG: hypothetical protein COC01_00230 [Bacteroidota bacterium]
MLFRLVFLSILLIAYFTKSSYSKTYSSQQYQVLSYNLLLNGIIGGVGGAINKKPNEKTWTAFRKNFLYGCLGGSIKYFAKYDIYDLRGESNGFWAKPNRLNYYIGHSIVHNASLNRKIWSSFNCSLYGLNIELFFKDSFYVKKRISTLTLYNLVYTISIGNKFNIDKSIKYGIFYFDMNPKISDAGYGDHNVISISSRSVTSVLPHEILHTYQHPDYILINNCFNHSFKRVRESKLHEIFRKYFYLDIAYMSMLYQVQPKPTHYKNFYEFEAQHFATRSLVNR